MRIQMTPADEAEYMTDNGWGESMFHRSAGSNAEGSGGRDHCGHLQEHGGPGIQPPPTWNRLRQTVRGWVLVVTPGCTYPPWPTLNVVVNQVLKTLSQRMSNTLNNQLGTFRKFWLVVTHYVKQTKWGNTQTAVFSLFWNINRSKQIQRGTVLKSNRKSCWMKGSVWDPLTENNNQTYECSSGTSSLIKLILEATSLRKWRKIKGQNVSTLLSKQMTIKRYKQGYSINTNKDSHNYYRRIFFSARIRGKPSSASIIQHYNTIFRLIYKCIIIFKLKVGYGIRFFGHFC